jgi:uncharacterized membrane protein YuzA (DUF378 family)
MATMTAEDRIKNLTNAWYGFAILSGAAGIVLNGIGLFSVLSGAFSTAVSLLITYWLGRALLGRSSFTRVLLMILSGLMFFVGLLGSGKLVLAFFGEWQFSLLAYAALGLAGVYMNGKSFATLSNKQVKAYFG